MSFLPEDYEINEGAGGFMKLEKGDNKFVILSSAVIGFVYWIDAKGQLVPKGERAGEGGKPVRVKSLSDIKHEGAQYDCKEFWAFIVYNLTAEKIQILDITQKTLMKAVMALVESEDWGDPVKGGYSITVTRTGDGFDTVYSVIPSPKKAIEYNKEDLNKIDLTALYRGENPFNKDESIDPEELVDKI